MDARNEMDWTGIARLVDSLQTRQRLSRLADARNGLKMLGGIVETYESVWRRALVWLSNLEGSEMSMPDGARERG